MARIRMGIVVLALLTPLTAHGQDPKAAPPEPKDPVVQQREEALRASAERGDTAAVNEWLAAGVDPNARTAGPAGSATALMKAVVSGHTVTVEALLAGGADVNAQDKSGVTAMIQADLLGHADIMRVLEEAGAKE